MEVHITVGNIGTGKSTLAASKDKSKWLVWDNDSIRLMFHTGTYVFSYKENFIISNLKFKFIQLALTEGFNIVIDDTNLKKKYRKEIIDCVKKTEENLGIAVRFVCYNFGAGTEESLKRRMDDPKGLESKDWIDVHERLAASYEEPELEEGIDEIIDMQSKESLQ